MMTRRAKLAALLACATPAAASAFGTAGSLRGAPQEGEEQGAAHRQLTTPRRDDSMTSSSTDDRLSPDREEEGYYMHLGCFQDTRDDRILGHRLASEDMSAKTCHKYCNVRGAFFMATQHGNECFCSREEDLEYLRHGIGKCDMACTGDNIESCGGYFAFDLYELVWPEPPSDPEFMECYSDVKEDRVMSHKISLDDMTTAVCRTHCETHDAMYYGTQYGRECWCGKSKVFEDYIRHGEGTCHMACSGDETVSCGGYDAFNLFRFMSPAAPTPEPPTPTPEPVAQPVAQPAVEPTPEPVAAPTPEPVAAPTPEPVAAPTPEPVAAPTPEPVAAPTPQPVAAPTPEPVDNESTKVFPFDGTEFSGDGTFYGATTDGNCAIRAPIPSMYSGMTPVALNAPQYSDSLLCGACIEGSGEGVGSGSTPIDYSFKGYVSDKCPECKDGDLDFAMAGDGRWDIKWKFVPCPGSNDKPSFLFEGSNQYYWKMQPRDTRTPVKELKVNGMGGVRTDDNFFEITTGHFSGPQEVETTTMLGAKVTQEVSL